MPDDLNRVILKCLEKEKETRYQSAGEVYTDLDRIEQGLPTAEAVVPKSKTITSKKITVTFGLNKLLIPALIVFTLIIVALIIWQMIPKEEIVIAPKIENSIAVISFKNQTGDKAYDYLQEAIPNLLITSLEQRGSLYVMTWERMNDLLKQLGKADLEAVDRDLGFKVCLMEGVEAIVLGSFVKAGEMFATDIKVLDVDTKKLLNSASSKGEGEGSIIRTQIDELSREISHGMRISPQKTEQSLPQVADVTTTSMEAYNYYLKGREAQSKLYWEDANKFYQKAVELDPEFATAYRLLANSYAWLGNTKERFAAYSKARELLGKTSGKERLYLEAALALSVEGDPERYLEIMKQIAEKYPREKRAHASLGYFYERRGRSDEAIEAFNRALALDPNDGITLNQLGYTYADKGDFAKAIEYFRKYASAYPDDANPHDSMGEIYYRMGRIDEAVGKFKEAIEVKPDFFLPYIRLGYIFALKENYPTAMEWIDKGYDIAQSPGPKMESYLLGAFIQYWRGRYEDALMKLQEVAGIAEEVEGRGRRNFIDNMMGWICWEKGDLELSRKYYRGWFENNMNIAPR